MNKSFLEKIFVSILILYFGLLKHADAQHFSAFSGSVYAPVINTAVQPSSGAEMPYRWGIEIGGVNTFWNNNILSISPAKFDWNQDTINLNDYLLSGKGRRWGTIQGDVHLLNFLFHVPRHEKWVIGAGWNVRSHTLLDRFNYDYSDSMTTFAPFLEANAVGRPQKGRIVDQQWNEWFINISTLVRENKFEKLAVGASLKLLKGMTGVAIDLKGLRIDPQKNNNGHVSVNYLAGRYGYSRNLEKLSEKNSTKEQMKTLVNGSPFSLGLDVGFTYTRKDPVYIAGFTNDEPTDYEWKLAVSLTDIGRLKYPLGSESRTVNGIKEDIDLDHTEQKLNGLSTLNEFNDSLAQVLNMQPWKEAVSITLPTALRISFDRKLQHNFFINTQLVLDVSFLVPGADYKTHTISYLTVTPRWEKKRVGFYAPVYLNKYGSFLVGGAFRLGPLVAGVHDFGWLFGHKKSGGAYVALVIKSLFREKEECPTF